MTGPGGSSPLKSAPPTAAARGGRPQATNRSAPRRREPSRLPHASERRRRQATVRGRPGRHQLRLRMRAARSCADVPRCVVNVRDASERGVYFESVGSRRRACGYPTLSRIVVVTPCSRSRGRGSWGVSGPVAPHEGLSSRRLASARITPLISRRARHLSTATRFGRDTPSLSSSSPQHSLYGDSEQSIY